MHHAKPHVVIVSKVMYLKQDEPLWVDGQTLTNKPRLEEVLEDCSQALLSRLMAITVRWTCRLRGRKHSLPQKETNDNT